MSGHAIEKCFRPGGGLAGQREEIMATQQHAQAFLAGSIHALEGENFNFSLPTVPDTDAIVISHPVSPYTSASPTTFDDTSNIEPFAALSVSSFPSSIERFDLYDLCDSSEFWNVAFLGIQGLSLTAFVSIANHYNALLDSSCTNHLFNDRLLFSDFDALKSVSIGTANCGSMRALGSGTVTFCYVHNGVPVDFVLHDCLFAPDVPIELLSVGALNNKGLWVVFETDAPLAMMTHA